jgi:hypothetical protein
MRRSFPIQGLGHREPSHVGQGGKNAERLPFCRSLMIAKRATQAWPEISRRREFSCARRDGAQTASESPKGGFLGRTQPTPSRAVLGQTRPSQPRLSGQAEVATTNGGALPHRDGVRHRLGDAASIAGADLAGERRQLIRPACRSERSRLRWGRRHASTDRRRWS